MNTIQHKLAPLLVAVFGAIALATSFAAEPLPEPKWLSLEGTFINLNEVVKIEVAGEKVTFISPTRKTVYQANPVRKEVLARLRGLLKDSPNWVEISKARNENQEWYANLARVPSILYGTALGNTQQQVYSGQPLTSATPMRISASSPATMPLINFFDTSQRADTIWVVTATANDRNAQAQL